MLRDFMDNGEPHSHRRERFCGHFVELCGDAMRAYRLAFVVDPQQNAQTVYAQVRKLQADPEIQRRIQEMRDAAALACGVSIRDLVQQWTYIATADPNEIVQYRRTACRWCWGQGHAYQWIDAAEYAAAVDQVTAYNSVKGAIQKPLPDMTGGFGYNENADPCETCPRCFSHGIGRAHVMDTRKLSTAARYLYKGVKETKNGIEVLLHDQHQAREALARVFGAFKDGAVLPTGQTNVPSKPVSAEDAQAAYLRVIRGGR